MSGEFTLVLPASTANLGPAFDTAALALNLHLCLRARLAGADSVTARGRDADRCVDPRDHMILAVYHHILQAAGRPIQPLALVLENRIPIGKGCGSSAAARIAGVALAAHFGQLGWSAQQIFESAAALEGHADNVAACWWGGLVLVNTPPGRPPKWLSVPVAQPWPMVLVVPVETVATDAARAVLPSGYGSKEAVANIQNVALLLQAWQLGRGDLLATAMVDHFHQPYRRALCPAMEALLPLAGQGGILACALSGAGPSVLIILRDEQHRPAAVATIQEKLLRHRLVAEVMPVAIERSGPGARWEAR